MPNGAEEHHAQLLEPVGPVDGLVLLGRGLDEVGSELGEVGLALGEAGRDDAGLGLCFGFGLCQCRCLCCGAACPDLCFVAAST